MAPQAVGVSEGSGRCVAAEVRMGTVAVEGGGIYAEEQVGGGGGGGKSERRANGECEGKDEGGRVEGAQGGWGGGGGGLRVCVSLKYHWSPVVVAKWREMRMADRQEEHRRGRELWCP